MKLLPKQIRAARVAYNAYSAALRNVAQFDVLSEQDKAVWWAVARAVQRDCHKHWDEETQHSRTRCTDDINLLPHLGIERCSRA